MIQKLSIPETYPTNDALKGGISMSIFTRPWTSKQDTLVHVAWEAVAFPHNHRRWVLVARVGKYRQNAHMMTCAYVAMYGSRQGSAIGHTANVVNGLLWRIKWSMFRICYTGFCITSRNIAGGYSTLLMLFATKAHWYYHSHFCRNICHIQMSLRISNMSKLYIAPYTLFYCYLHFSDT